MARLATVSCGWYYIKKDGYAAETGHSQVRVVSYSPNTIRQSGQSAFHMVLITSVHKLKLQISRHVAVLYKFIYLIVKIVRQNL